MHLLMYQGLSFWVFVVLNEHAPYLDPTTDTQNEGHWVGAPGMSITQNVGQCIITWSSLLVKQQNIDHMIMYLTLNCF